MADISLHGNGETCPACELQREVHDPLSNVEIPCNYCGGVGKIEIEETTILKRATEWAKKNYWPERERIYAAFNAAQALK